MNKTWIGALTLAATLGGFSVPASAQVSIHFGPPAPRVEAVPAPRRGEVWTPGYWDLRGRRHVWVAGQYVRDRPGYAYSQPQWVSNNGRWVLVRGHWTQAPRGNAYGYGNNRDSDRDGIPNRYDRDLDNDGVRNRNDRDRDGDGVPNRRDARPDNPNRR